MKLSGKRGRFAAPFLFAAALRFCSVLATRNSQLRYSKVHFVTGFTGRIARGCENQCLPQPVDARCGKRIPAAARSFPKIQAIANLAACAHTRAKAFGTPQGRPTLFTLPPPGGRWLEFEISGAGRRPVSENASPRWRCCVSGVNPWAKPHDFATGSAISTG